MLELFINVVNVS